MSPNYFWDGSYEKKIRTLYDPRTSLKKNLQTKTPFSSTRWWNQRKNKKIYGGRKLQEKNKKILTVAEKNFDEIYLVISL